MSHRRPTLSITALTALLTTACAAPADELGDESELADGESEASAYRFDIGFQTHSCSTTEDDKIKAAWDILYNLRGAGRARFDQCLANARLVETGRGRNVEDCQLQNDRSELSRAILENTFVEATCEDLNPDGPSADGSVVSARGALGIDDTRIRVDHNFLATSSAQRVAAVIAHEIMHNRGFSHSANDFGTSRYGLTVPEQVEACVTTGTPNAPPAGHPDIAADCAARAPGEGVWICDHLWGCSFIPAGWDPLASNPEQGCNPLFDGCGWLDVPWGSAPQAPICDPLTGVGCF